MEVFSTDVLVIGSGLAGVVAALEADRLGLQTVLLGKFAIGTGTNSALANGGFTVANGRFSKEKHLRMTLEAGRGLNNISLVEKMIERGPEAMERLRSYGVSLVESGAGYWVGRSEESVDLPGILMMRPLVQRLKTSAIRMLPGFVVFDLVVEEGEARGAFGFSRDGRPFLIQANAIILATGGAGGIYLRNDNQRTIRGDGYALALRAGLSLHDLEFVQFYPLVIAEPGLSTFIFYPPYPKEVRMFTEREEDVFDSLEISDDLNGAIVNQRDRFSIALFELSQKNDVYLDFTQVPEEAWSTYPLNFLKRSKFPFRERPLLVAPAVHFFMGGVEVDDHGKTALPGLFAAGEVAWGIHGANRLGGNALTECSVFGIRAGAAAANYAKKRGRKGAEVSLLPEKSLKRWERKAAEYLKKKRGTFDHPGNLLKEMKDLSWRYVGPVRDADSLSKGLDLLAAVEKKIDEIYPLTLKDLFRKREMENMVLLLKALLKGSLLRRESRGSFYRKDFLNQDDPHWKRSSCHRLNDGEIEITYPSGVSPQS